MLDARTTYWARVRWVDGETLGEWSSGAKFFYADLTLPVLRIDTDGGAPIIDKENYLGATISIDPNGSGDTAYSPARTEIKGRGNSTWGAPKKPYKLKLSSKASLLGMPASKHWVLLANFFDPSHLRNEIAFQLSKQTSLAWTPRFRFVEVILNGSYDGLYMLGEHIRVEPTRVNIDEMDENDLEGEALTGGYLMEFDFRFNPSIDPGFVSSTGLKVEVKDPEPVEPQQLSYINSYFNSFEAATLGSSFKDPSLGYAAYLDVDKFIDWYLIAELARQQDGMMSSTYVSKPRNGKLTFGPVWDFDLSMGALNSLTPGWPSEGWHINNPALWTFSDVGKWLPRLFQDPALKAQVKARWQALAPALLNVVDSIPTTGAAIDPARDTDAARWRNYPHDPDLDPTLQSWLRRRINWMGANL